METILSLLLFLSIRLRNPFMMMLLYMIFCLNGLVLISKILKLLPPMMFKQLILLLLLRLSLLV
jgi:hypothetical protein